MNRLTREKRIQIVSMLCEGMSIRAICRITGVSKTTVLKLIPEIGLACADYQDRVMRNLKCQRLQLDECWAVCYAKQRNVPEHLKDQVGYGDVWTWVAIDADTKLVPYWLVGERDAHTAHHFVSALADRMANRIQLTTDGYKAYAFAVDAAFGNDIDFAMIQKIYAGYNSKADDLRKEARYSPGRCISQTVVHTVGEPNRDHISNTYVERQNLTLRMHMRRFTRLTNAFSKKLVNHAASVALHYMYYNFCLVQKGIRCTPAMAAGITDHVWEVSEIVDLLAQTEKSALDIYKSYAA